MPELLAKTGSEQFVEWAQARGLSKADATALRDMVNSEARALAKSVEYYQRSLREAEDDFADFMTALDTPEGWLTVALRLQREEIAELRRSQAELDGREYPEM